MQSSITIKREAHKVKIISYYVNNISRQLVGSTEIQRLDVAQAHVTHVLYGCRIVITAGLMRTNVDGAS